MITKDDAYQMLADLIFKGFLTMSLDIGDRHFILKTVNEKEYDMVKIYSGNPKSFTYEQNFNIYFLLYSLFMVDGNNIMIARGRNIPELREFILGLPNKLFIEMMQQVGSIRNMAYDVIKYLEGFTYTEHSRRQWKSIGGMSPNLEEFTGIPGTESMGINVHQENWMLINRMLDKEEDYNQQFSMAIMVASASNPKGAKQIRGKHDSAVQNSEDRRKKLAMVGYIDHELWTPEGWAAPVETAEELIAELDRQISGVKDKHDIFMESYLKKMRENAEARTRKVQERIEEARKAHEDEAMITGSQRALTPQEAKVLMNKRSNLITTSAEDQATVEDKQRFVKKVGSRVLTGK